MKLLRLVKKWLRIHRKRRTVNGVYVGRVCEICGTVLKGGTKTKHIQENHPEKGKE